MTPKEELEIYKEKYKDVPSYLLWKRISCEDWSKEFIEKYKNRVDWIEISKVKTLSEDFIREFVDEVDWYEISKYQKLSEDFIIEFSDKVDWDNIWCEQTISKKFLKNNFQRMTFEAMNAMLSIDDNESPTIYSIQFNKDESLYHYYLELKEQYGDLI